MPSPSPEERIAALEQEVSALRQQVAGLSQNSLRLDRLLHPRTGFFAGCVFTAAFALFCLFVFEGQKLSLYLTYFAPIALPFTGFVFDRLSRLLPQPPRPRRWGPPALDGLVLAVSLARSVYNLPFISGHAFFLTYTLLTVKSGWVRIPALLVLAQVIFLKVFVWSDPTLYGGALAGCLAAALWWALSGKTKTV